jgi:cytoskeletal protein CcmA (bactofilin family)
MMRKKSREPKFDTLTSNEPVVMGDKTIIGEGITIEGTIRGKEDLIIEGTVKGNIEVAGNHLTIGRNGMVEAEINAESVTISGRLKGNVKAVGRVAITEEADFNGEIHARTISVKDGAFLKAVIELEREADSNTGSEWGESTLPDDSIPDVEGV